LPRFGRRRAQSRASEGARLFFATDVHGSDRCFRKFLNAAAFYRADYLVLGGDITGKSLVPIEQTPRGWSARYRDHEYVDLTESERAELEQRIRDGGQYPIVGERDELLALNDEARRDRAFRTLVIEGVRRWVELAEQRLRGTAVRCFVTPGNDDFLEIDEPLRGSEVVEFVEGRCVRLDDQHEMITTGYSNRTPWDTPRELDEPELRERIEAMFAQVEDPDRLIAVLHPPPYGTDLDRAPAIDAEFRVQIEGGQPRMTAVGSSAVRDFILERAPLLGLHGHVHESRGAQLLGRTLCLNPGSEYTEAVLAGALVTLSGGRIAAHQFVAG
jgi:Icc-related predicted phosphoesterase